VHPPPRHPKNSGIILASDLQFGQPKGTVHTLFMQNHRRRGSPKKYKQCRNGVYSRLPSIPWLFHFSSTYPTLVHRRSTRHSREDSPRRGRPVSVENPHAGFPVLFNSQLRFLRLQCKAGLAHYFSPLLSSGVHRRGCISCRAVITTFISLTRAHNHRWSRADSKKYLALTRSTPRGARSEVDRSSATSVPSKKNHSWFRAFRPFGTYKVTHILFNSHKHLSFSK
jgi:hypothetical protein